jgi:hypothetical protein
LFVVAAYKDSRIPEMGTFGTDTKVKIF